MLSSRMGRVKHHLYAQIDEKKPFLLWILGLIQTVNLKFVLVLIQYKRAHRV